jgi:DNA adenine methylase
MKPLFKWAGGKSTALPELLERIPTEIRDYHELFLGSASVYLNVHDRIKGQAYLSDANNDLIDTHKRVKDKPDLVYHHLTNFALHHSKDFYISVRSDHEMRSGSRRAARFIYLLRSCFNGLYRVNKKGQFNVPIGTGKPNVRFSRIRQVSDALKKATISCRDFKKFDTSNLKKGDFVYLDPPYHQSYSAYTTAGFTDNDHIALRDLCSQIDKTGAFFMLSNSITDFIKNLYENYNCNQIEIRRGMRRKREREHVITNY